MTKFRSYMLNLLDQVIADYSDSQLYELLADTFNVGNEIFSCSDSDIDYCFGELGKTYTDCYNCALGSYDYHYGDGKYNDSKVMAAYFHKDYGPSYDDFVIVYDIKQDIFVFCPKVLMYDFLEDDNFIIFESLPFHFDIDNFSDRLKFYSR